MSRNLGYSFTTVRSLAYWLSLTYICGRLGAREMTMSTVYIMDPRPS